ncbi:YggS family pyridoxal phosphate-dependent enzyme [Marixanthomonas sp. SCSIO 43207]|uniref:YggS family pyridoxal phosphate-dependent enzyme n=1 Tax=Marixanthomonas sp. SCSIO 43207 TaxID=2779360 RepID=UPI001CA86994|nr:YggS family pyridoxal phosphate-dependent enzyme [Marixanthomonas sp. SCSIO 43207]UAB81155.1 YggS family pyridoxal phosphate-dependent enzyme [Marixanthomonas sp. SCSIO 43207]
MSVSENIKEFKNNLPEDVTLVAVSKTKPVSEIMEAYNTGHRIFGENKVQEMEAKWEEMPKDIEWHMIGHVQRNKVKYMAPFVSLIHSVDSKRLLKEVNKQAKKVDRVIDCLLQIKIAEEDSKFGLDKNEALELLASEAFQKYENVRVIGLMGMATFTDNENQISEEFKKLKQIYDSVKDDYNFTHLSMGMSGDYSIAIKHGSNIVRVGSAIFGERNY